MTRHPEQNGHAVARCFLELIPKCGQVLDR